MLGDVLLFRVAKRPDFVALNPLGREVVDIRVMEAQAGSADLFDEAENRHLRGAGHAAGRGDRVAFDERHDDAGAFLGGQLVHGYNLCLTPHVVNA